jgi:hypothetical protein
VRELLELQTSKTDARSKGEHSERTVASNSYIQEEKAEIDESDTEFSILLIAQTQDASIRCA